MRSTPSQQRAQRQGRHATDAEGCRLVGIMQQHAESKPTLIFVPTRKAASQAALAILKDYKATYTRNEPGPWRRPQLNEPLVYKDKALTGEPRRCMREDLTPNETRQSWRRSVSPSTTPDWT